MINITHKRNTLRKAIAQAKVCVSSKKTIDCIKENKVPKGDIFSFSRASGLLAIKKTAALIPDCHPLPIEFAQINFTLQPMAVMIEVEVHTIYKTGVEVEAMHGASLTALTIYDMLKPIDKGLSITDICLMEKKGGKSDLHYEVPKNIKTALVICSNGVFDGKAKDKTGDCIVDQLAKMGNKVVDRIVIRDDAQQIVQQVKSMEGKGIELLIFAGGTGLGPYDITPDTLKPLISKEIPGIMEAARLYGLERTPFAMLSRGIAGFIGKKMLVLTLPGSPKGAKESIDALFPQLFHIFSVLAGKRHN